MTILLILLVLYLFIDMVMYGPLAQFIDACKDAAEYAESHYRNCTPRPLLWIDKKTNTWCTREYTDAEKKRLCFKSYMKHR